MAIDPKLPIPVYFQLKTLLLEEILDGRYGPDGRLPTEHQLCERHGIPYVQESVWTRARDCGAGQVWLAAAYCSSVTGSSQVVPSPLSVPSSMAKWHIRLSAVPPCQCSSPGEV